MTRPWYQLTSAESAHLASLDAEHNSEECPYIHDVLEDSTETTLHYRGVQMRLDPEWLVGRKFEGDVVRCSIWPITLIEGINHGQRTPGRWWTSVSGEFTAK